MESLSQIYLNSRQKGTPAATLCLRAGQGMFLSYSLFAGNAQQQRQAGQRHQQMYHGAGPPKEKTYGPACKQNGSNYI